jgi:hypothetical protein
MTARATVDVRLALDILAARLPPIRYDDLAGLLLFTCDRSFRRQTKTNDGV